MSIDDNPIEMERFYNFGWVIVALAVLGVVTYFYLVGPLLDLIQQQSPQFRALSETFVGTAMS